VGRRNGLRVVFISIFLAIVSLAGSATEPSWQFIFASDSRSKKNGVNTVILGELAAEAVKKQVDFFLFSGDMAQAHVNQAEMDNQLKKWRDTMQPAYDAGIGVYAVRGNHDIDCPHKDTSWNNIFKDKYAMPDNGPAGEENMTYSFKHKNAFIVGLDDYARPGYSELHRVNQEWLDSQFAANTEPHVFVFGHDPAFKVRHENCLDNYAAERDKFWDSIKKAGGRTYFCGHDRFYNHARVDDDGDPNNDIHQFISGTAGSPLFDWSGKYDGNNSHYTVKGIYHSKEYGYCLVKIDGLDVTVTWMERVSAGKYETKDVWSYTASVPMGQR
jgi:predicted MPP superfamily phosphohydrolase